MAFDQGAARELFLLIELLDDLYKKETVRLGDEAPFRLSNGEPVFIGWNGEEYVMCS